MAEFCLECVNKYFADEGEEVTENDVKMKFELCEGCEEWKPCVITIKRRRVYKFIKQFAAKYKREAKDL